MAISGNNLKVQVAAESAYGTAVAMTNQVKVFSEGFKYNPSKKEEGLLTGMRSVGRSDTMSKSVEGAVSFLMRPDDGLFLALALGVEDAPELVAGASTAYKHTFDAIDHTATLPSASFMVDRGVTPYTYTGMSVKSISFAAAPEDYLKVDVTMVGREEIDGTPNDTLNVSPLKAFKFRHAKVKLNNSTVADVTDLKFSYDNALTANQQTTSTGNYFMKPEPGPRAITADVEAVYTAATDGIRNDFFKTDDETSLEIEFISDEVLETIAGSPDELVYYSLKIFLPHVQITEASANIGGPDLVKQQMSLAAFEGINGLISVELVNSRATKYI